MPYASTLASGVILALVRVIPVKTAKPQSLRNLISSGLANVTTVAD